MNVREFRDWLSQFDDDVIVQVLVQEDPAPYQSYGACQEVDFNSEENHYDYVDFTENPYVGEDHPFYGKRILLLGEPD